MGTVILLTPSHDKTLLARRTLSRARGIFCIKRRWIALANNLAGSTSSMRRDKADKELITRKESGQNEASPTRSCHSQYIFPANADRVQNCYDSHTSLTHTHKEQHPTVLWGQTEVEKREGWERDRERWERDVTVHSHKECLTVPPRLFLWVFYSALKSVGRCSAEWMRVFRLMISVLCVLGSVSGLCILERVIWLVLCENDHYKQNPSVWYRKQQWKEWWGLQILTDTRTHSRATEACRVRDYAD